MQNTAFGFKTPALEDLPVKALHAWMSHVAWQQSFPQVCVALARNVGVLLTLKTLSEYLRINSFLIPIS